MTAMVDYGYGDATPTTNQENVDYGYGDAQPDYGYGDAKPDTTDYGYGDAKPETTDYGYGDAQPDYGYGDGSPDGDATDDDQQPKRRNRRRNSVTRYSIVCQDAVKNEFEAHANIIDQFRNGASNAPAGPPPDLQNATMEPLKDYPGVQMPRGSSHSDDGRSFEGSLDSMDGSDVDGRDKSKKKKKGWGFRLGRSNTN
jgi:hypothetical protein